MYRSSPMDVYLGHRLSKYDSMHTQTTDRRKHFAAANSDSSALNFKETPNGAGSTITQGPTMRPKLFDKDGDWKPSRVSQLGTSPGHAEEMSTNTQTASRINGAPNSNPFYAADTDNTDWPSDFNPADQSQMREAINQELVDLLRSQIACLLEEKDKILLTLDDYRERLAVMDREKKESTPDPSSDCLALQTELSEARLREAELTVAFGELQHRIAEIDRMIESDPDMEAFFNAVTISPTTLSRQKPLHRTPSSRTDSPATRPTRNVRSARDPEHHFSPSRRNQNYSTEYGSPKHITVHQSPTRNRRTPLRNTGQYSTSRSGDNYSHGEIDSDQSTTYPRSGLESPQSDSGCSLNSHTTSESRDANTDPSFDDSDARKGSAYGRGVSSGRRGGSGSGGDGVRSCTDAEQDMEDQENRDGSQLNQSGRPRNYVSLIRRSRSTAAEHSFMSGFHSEMHSPVGYDDSNDAESYTPTPTNHPPTMPSCESSLGETKAVDKFSRLRASFRQSFGLGPAKPDFRTEAFAARQGEARALLSLRETRMELLRVQSRCQTLQRHMERLEAINHSRMEDLEATVITERDLRQEIRNLQRRIFELEAEHREFKVNQRIKEMELISKLAETNMRLSHAELNSQQAVLWSELSQAHDAASSLLTPAHSNLSVYSPTPMAGSGSRDPSNNRTSPTSSDRARPDKLTLSSAPMKNRPSFEYTVARRDAAKRQMDIENVNNSDRNASWNDVSNPTGKSATDAHKNGSKMIDRSPSQRAMDQSMGSLSDLRLQVDSSLMTRPSMCKP